MWINYDEDRRWNNITDLNTFLLSKKIIYFFTGNYEYQDPCKDKGNLPKTLPVFIKHNYYIKNLCKT